MEDYCCDYIEEIGFEQEEDSASCGLFDEEIDFTDIAVPSRNTGNATLDSDQERQIRALISRVAAAVATPRSDTFDSELSEYTFESESSGARDHSGDATALCHVTSQDKDEIRRELQALQGLLNAGFMDKEDYVARRRQLLYAKRHAARRIAVALHDWESRLRKAEETEGDEVDAEEREKNKKRDRNVRVFVSSTFRDMGTERELLIKRTIPELQRFCSERGVLLTAVDLRWGITSEQSGQGETLNICLTEVDNCRPYFVGMLGDRYGWAQPKNKSDSLLHNTFKKASIRYPWVRNFAERSVTELEVRHAVLNDPLSETARRSLFYFKKSAKDESGETEDKVKLREALKQEIQNASTSFNNPVKIYSNPQELSDDVLAKLKKQLERDFPINDQPSQLEKERQGHIAFQEMRSKVYVSRELYFYEIDSLAEYDKQPIVITGESGSGKSALLANWTKRFQENHPTQFVVAHYIGATASSVELAGLLKRVISEISERFAIEMTLPSDVRDLARIFPELLSEASSRGGMVLVLDALDQLSESDNARELAWLPMKLPSNVSLVVSTLPGRCLEALKKRAWRQLQVTELTMMEREQMAELYMTSHGKTLNPAQMQKLVSAPQTGNPLFLKIVLDELRVFGVFEQLEQRIDHYLIAQTPPKLFGLVFERLEADFESDQSQSSKKGQTRRNAGFDDVCDDEVEDMQFFDQSSGQGAREGLVGSVFSYLCVARKGLSERELLSFLGVPYAVWSPLYIAIGESLAVRSGFLSFFHDYMRHAVLERYLNTSQRIQNLRNEMIAFFSSGDLATKLGLTEEAARMRMVEEVAFQKQQSGDWIGLAEFITDLQNFEILIRDENKVDFYKFWRYIQQQSGVSVGQQTQTEHLLVNKLQQLYATTSRVPDQLTRTCALLTKAGQVLQDLAAFNSAEQLFLQLLSIRENQQQEASRRAVSLSQRKNLVLSKLDEDHHLAIALSTLGELYELTGKYAKAKNMLERALQIVEQKVLARQKDEDYDDDDAEDDATLLTKEKDIETNIKKSLGTVYRHQGKYPAALQILQEVLREMIAESGSTSEGVAAVYHQLGLVHQNMGQYPKSAHYLGSSTRLKEILYGRDHPKVALSLKDEGDLYLLWSKYDEALELFARALAIFENTFGPTHPNYADAEASIGAAHFHKGLYSESEAYLQRAIEKQCATIGEFHSDIANTYSTMAGLHLRQRNFERAHYWNNKALEIRRIALGEEHPDYVSSLANVGATYQKDKQYSQALGYFEDALARFERIYEDGMHMDIASALINLAATCQKLKQNDRCAVYYTRAVDILLELLGPWHHFTAVTLNDIAILLTSVGLVHDSADMFENALKSYRQVFGEVHPSTAQVLFNYGDMWKIRNNNDKALECFEHAHRIFQQTLGDENEKTQKAWDAMQGLRPGQRPDEDVAQFDEAFVREPDEAENPFSGFTFQPDEDCSDMGGL